MQNRTLYWLVFGGLILLIAAAHVAARRPGHVWGDDFAQYVHHAKNLVEGIPYAETGYLYNPDYPQIGPPTYPPIAAVVLAPVYWASGLDLEAMKAVMLVCFLVFLLAVLLCFHDELSPGAMAALVAVLGLNYFFLEDTNVVGSDMPFLALLYLAILLVRRGEAAERSPASRTAYYLAAGLVAYLAYGTRSLGALLMPAVVLADLARTRRITRPVILACVVFACLAAAQSRLFHSDTGYLDQFRAGPSVLLGNAVSYATQMAAFWHNGYNKPAAVAVFTAVTLLAVLGYVVAVRRRVGTCEVFVIVYPAIILLWPSYQGIRYLYPILPLYLFYALKGLEHPWLARTVRLRRAVIASLALAVGLSYAAMATATDFGPQREGVTRPESVALFDYIRSSAGPDDVVVFIKPRAMSLFAGRASSVYHQPEDDQELWAYFDKIGARWLVVAERDAAFEDFERPEVLIYLQAFVRRNSSRLERVWGNADFTVYRIRKEGIAAGP